MRIDTYIDPQTFERFKDFVRKGLKKFRNLESLEV